MTPYEFIGPYPPPPPQKKKKNKGVIRAVARHCICRCLLHCCCGLFKCCLGCILHLVCKIICTVLIVVAIIALILWLLFQPTNLEFHADQASLADFNLAGNTLRYDLALNITARNPNTRLTIIYEDIEALAFYQDEKFAAERLPTFTQGTDSTNTITAGFKGQNTAITLGDEARANYEEEKSAGEFAIDVRVQLKIKFQMWVLHPPFSIKPSFVCDLQVPLNSSGKPFQGKDCAFDWQKLLTSDPDH